MKMTVEELVGHQAALEKLFNSLVPHERNRLLADYMQLRTMLADHMAHTHKTKDEESTPSPAAKKTGK